MYTLNLMTATGNKLMQILMAVAHCYMYIHHNVFGMARYPNSDIFFGSYRSCIISIIESAEVSDLLNN